MSAPDDATLRALMAARTQGTWHDCYVDTGLREIYGDDGLVAAVGDPNTVHPNDPAASAAEADAQLVAIAPELAAEVLWLRERVARAEAERDALRAAAGSYLVTVTGCAAAGVLLEEAQAAYERAVDQVRAEPGNPSHRTEVAHAAVRLSAAGLAYIDADLTRDAARERLRTLAGEG